MIWCLPFVLFSFPCCLAYLSAKNNESNTLCSQHQGPLRSLVETDNTLLRVDFVREVDALLHEVRLIEEDEEEAGKKGDPEAIARKLKQQEKKRTIRQVEALLDLALNLKW